MASKMYTAVTFKKKGSAFKKTDPSHTGKQVWLLYQHFSYYIINKLLDSQISSCLLTNQELKAYTHLASLETDKDSEIL